MEKDYLEKKWLADDLSNVEKEAFDKLKDADFNRKIIKGAQRFKASQFSKIKDFDVLNTKLEQKSIPDVQLNTFKILFRIAALFVVSLGIYFTFFYTSVTTIQTYASQKTNITLPDASSAILNAGSEIVYKKREWQKKRTLNLKGEAYFKVAKGSKFEVITPNGIVSVLGTKFNLKSRENYFEVICFEGLVSVSSKGETIKLPQGKSIRILNGKMVNDDILDDTPDWLTDTSRYKSVPLKHVLDEFERQYNVKIITNNVDTQRLFTGSFVHTNLELALKTITVPFNLTYKKDSSNHITIYHIE